MASWDGVDGKYDPDKFYTAGGDSKGHSHEIRAQFPTQIVGSIGAIVESRVIPEYKTKGHFLRDAAFHRLHVIQRIMADPELDRMVSMATLIHGAVQREKDLAEAENHLERVGDLLRRYQRANQDAEMEDFITEQTAGLHLLPPELRASMVDLLQKYT